MSKPTEGLKQDDWELGRADGYRTGLEAAIPLACHRCSLGESPTWTGGNIWAHFSTSPVSSEPVRFTCSAFNIRTAIRALTGSAPLEPEGGAQ